MNHEKKTTIGGQAVIEGIAMRGPSSTTLVCRLPNGELDIERFESRKKFMLDNIPIIRGMINFVFMTIDGYKFLNKSIEKSELIITQKQESKGETDERVKKKGEKVQAVTGVIGMMLGFLIAIILFVWVPQTLTKLFMGKAATNTLRAIIEGIIKIFMLVTYMFLVSNLKEIKRVFMYHGAEHKTISCYEKGSPLNIENVNKSMRFHPRCGTNFLFIIIIISTLISVPINWNNLAIRMFTKLALVPVNVGIGYELVKLAGKSGNVFVKIISAPGLWLQKITTKEPDDEQIEVAIAALKDVLDNMKEGADDWK